MVKDKRGPQGFGDGKQQVFCSYCKQNIWYPWNEREPHIHDQCESLRVKLPPPKKIPFPAVEETKNYQKKLREMAKRGK